MKRPPLTHKQREYAKRQRALKTLAKMAVRYSAAGDEANGLSGGKSLDFAFADLTIACDRYANALTERERRKLCK